jgi:type II secretory ATPase GspE/PulE/Tfp pilus assembly ATPase PilB-like protein
LHTNDAPYHTLAQHGIALFNIASSVILISAQFGTQIPVLAC